MDTIIFGLILLAAVAVLQGRSRRDVLLIFAGCLVAVLLLFNHHVTDPLGLNF